MSNEQRTFTEFDKLLFAVSKWLVHHNFKGICSNSEEVEARSELQTLLEEYLRGMFLQNYKEMQKEYVRDAAEQLSIEETGRDSRRSYRIRSSQIPVIDGIEFQADEDANEEEVAEDALFAIRGYLNYTWEPIVDRK